MLQTSARLLRLLALLETRRDWTGAELAERLEVTTRTIRSDIDKLRDLGYPVQATPGVAGGYRLGVGAALPPLLLDDEEAVAVAVGLRTAAGVEGIQETSVRALAKLEQVLPSRLRERVNAVQSATVTVPVTGPEVDSSVLSGVAAAIRARERLRFDYADHGGSSSRREVEPHRLVNWGRRWYLVAWDKDRAAWRTFRVDRMSPRTPTGPRFAPREPPGGDASAFVRQGVGTATWRYFARVLLHASPEYVRQRMPVAVSIEPAGPGRCIASVGSDDPQTLILYLGLLDVDFEVLDNPDFVAHVEKMANRLHRAATVRS